MVASATYFDRTTVTLNNLGISVRALSLALHVPYSRLREIVGGKRGVSADTALRLESGALFRQRGPRVAESTNSP